VLEFENVIKYGWGEVFILFRLNQVVINFVTKLQRNVRPQIRDA